MMFPVLIPVEQRQGNVYEASVRKVGTLSELLMYVDESIEPPTLFCDEILYMLLDFHGSDGELLWSTHVYHPFGDGVSSTFDIDILQAHELYYAYYAFVDIGADSVYVGHHAIRIPNDIDAELISDVSVIYMGALHDVLNKGFWSCITEVKELMRHPIDDVSKLVVFEFLSGSNEFLGHGVSHSPVFNADTHECYEIKFIGIKPLMQQKY